MDKNIQELCENHWCNVEGGAEGTCLSHFLKLHFHTYCDSKLQHHDCDYRHVHVHTEFLLRKNNQHSLTFYN